MKPIYIFALIFLLVGGLFSVSAQDKIVLRNGEIIEAKVTELSSTEIRYKRYDNLNGPVVVVPRANVLVIEYENGQREIINADGGAQAAQASSRESGPKKTAMDPNKLTFGMYFNPMGFLTLGPIIGTEFTYRSFITDIHVRLPQFGFMMKLIESDWDDFDICTMKSGIGIGLGLKYFLHTSNGGFYVGGFFEYSTYKAEYDYGKYNYSNYNNQGKATSEVAALAFGTNLGYKFAWPHVYLRLGPYFGYAAVIKSDWTSVLGNKTDYSGDGYIFFMADVALGFSF